MDYHADDLQSQPYYSGCTPRTFVAKDGLCPINILPCDTLIEIFIHLRNMSPTVYLEYPDVEEHLQALFEQVQWTVVSHVCRRWRDVALNSPTLWTLPSLIFPSWATAMLERSRKAKIQSIDIDWSLIKREVISSAVKHLPRAIDFTLRNADKSQLEELSRKMSGMETPNLRWLRIRPMGGHFYFDRSHDRQAFLLPDEVFINARNLQYLNTWTVDISWTPHLLSSLRQLCLHNISHARRPTIAQLRSMLKSIPNLQGLALYDALPTINSEEEAMASGERLPLDHLETLAVGSNSLEIKAFALNFAPGPNIQEVSINIVHEGEQGDLLEGSQRALVEQCPWSQVKVVKLLYELSLTDDTKDGWGFEIATKSGSEFTIHVRGRCVAVDGDLIAEGEVASELRFLQLFDAIDSNHLDDLDQLDLTLSDRPYTNTPLWGLVQVTFGTLPNLREIVVSAKMVWVLIGALNNITRFFDEADDTAPFPGLSSLRLQSVEFMRVAGKEFFYDTLVACIQKRCSGGLPCCNVVLEDCAGPDIGMPGRLWERDEAMDFQGNQKNCTCQLEVGRFTNMSDLESDFD